MNPAPSFGNMSYVRLALLYDKGRFDEVVELAPSLAATAERAAAFAAAVEHAKLAVDGERAVGRPERETDRLPGMRFQLRARVVHPTEIGVRDFSRERVVDVVAAEEA